MVAHEEAVEEFDQMQAIVAEGRRLVEEKVSALLRQLYTHHLNR